MNRPLDDDIPRRHPDIPWRRVEDEVFIITPFDGNLHNLQAVGARFWELCDGEREWSAIIDSLLEEYDVDRAVLETDLSELVEQLVRRQVLEVVR